MAFQQEHHRTPLGHNLFMLEVKCQSARVRSISKLETFQQSCGDIPHPLSMLNRLYRLPSWSMIIDKSFFFGEVPLSKNLTTIPSLKNTSIDSNLPIFNPILVYRGSQIYCWCVSIIWSASHPLRPCWSNPWSHWSRARAKTPQWSA